MKTAVSDLLFPVLCAGCRRRAPSGLCDGCLSEIEMVEAPWCPRCGAPQPHPSVVCRTCRLAPEWFSARQAVWMQGIARGLIHRLKYGAERSVAEALAGLLLHVWTADAPRTLTWMPASKSRSRSRGIDHAKVLTEAFGEALSIQPVKLLERTFDPDPQTTLQRDARSRNVSGSLRCRIPSPERVLVIDDVFTTGASAGEAARALKAAGAREVVALSVARTPEPGRPR